ncbi:hypothetical protein ACHAXS_005037 [Conticribra weissflogii]
MWISLRVGFSVLLSRVELLLSSWSMMRCSNHQYFQKFPQNYQTKKV